MSIRQAESLETGEPKVDGDLNYCPNVPADGND